MYSLALDQGIDGADGSSGAEPGLYNVVTDALAFAVGGGRAITQYADGTNSAV